MTANLRAKALRFLERHRDGRILVLPNAWDAAIARIFAACGAEAVGTTSMGVAAAAGLPDVQQLPLDDMLRAVARIAHAVDVPVTADMEAGYGSTTEAVVASIERAVACGAVGINIEDGTGDSARPLIDTELLVERIAAIRAAMRANDLPLVINARTDVFLRQVGAADRRLAETIVRGNAYRAAGADCVFVPGGLARETIAALVRELDAPLNVVANPAISVPVVPPVPELQDLGVRRVSIGSGATRAVLSFVRRIATELLDRGTYDLLAAELGAPGAAGAYAMAIGKKP